MTIRVDGHFGEWLQGRLGEDGPLVLVTLPCGDFHVRSVEPAEASAPPFDEEQLSELLQFLGLNGDAGVALQSNIPPGCGAGSSTAYLVAYARAHGFNGNAACLAKACLSVESATDPLMFDSPDAMLWASREGHPVENIASPPHAAVVGGFWGQPLRTNGADMAFSDISDLIPEWKGAVQDGDLGKAARIASESAGRCKTLRGPSDPMQDLMRQTRALGWVRAHTGSARGLVFAPGTHTDHAMGALREAGLTHVFRFEAGVP